MSEYKPLVAQKMKIALARLDELITEKYPSKTVTFIIGGGSAMILAHAFPLATTDIDAIPKGMDLQTLDPLIKQVATDLSIAPDWLNTYYSTFSHTLPGDYSRRLITVFSGKSILAQALGREEMLIMKCFAHRQKDVGHAMALIKKGVKVGFVESHIESLLKKQIPGAQNALDFLDDILDQAQ